MNICNTENLIIPGFCQMIPGFVTKSLDSPGIPGWLVSMSLSANSHTKFVAKVQLPTLITLP